MEVINGKDARSSGTGTGLKSGEALPEAVRLRCCSSSSYLLYRLLFDRSCSTGWVIPHPLLESRFGWCDACADKEGGFLSK